MSTSHPFYIRASNRDRTFVSTDTNSGARFRFPSIPVQNTSNPSAQYICAVKKIEIQNWIYTIQAGINDRIRYSYNGTDYEEVFAEGNYTIDTLVSALNTAFQVRNASFLFSYDDTLTNKLSLFVPSGVTLILKRPLFSSNIQVQNTLKLPSPYDRFYEILGWLDLKSDSRVITGPTTFLGGQPVNLYGTHYLDLNVNAFLGNLTTAAEQNSIMVRIPVDNTFGDMILFEPQIPPEFRLHFNHIMSLEVFITDEWNVPVTLPPNALVMFELSFQPV